MEAIKAIIDDFVKKTPFIQGKLKGYQATELWPKIIDQEGRSWVSSFSAGTLTIFTENPSFGQEISFGKSRIIEELNNRVGQNTVTNIRVKIGSKESDAKTGGNQTSGKKE